MPVIVVLAFLGGLICIVVCTPSAEARAAASAEALYDGHAVTVHTLIDKAQGKSWRFIVVERGPLLIPGSEAPWHEQIEKAKP